MNLIKRYLFCFLFSLFGINAIGQTCNLDVTIAASGTVVCAGSFVTLTATPNNGTPPYTYQWTTGETTQSINVTSQASYGVTVTDKGAGCAPVNSAIIIYAPNFLSVAGTTVCSGNPATLSASGADTYQWFDAQSGGNLVGSGASFTTPVLASTQTYYVVGVKNGCKSFPIPVTATVIATPVNPQVANPSICAGNNVTLSVTSAGERFEWYSTPTGGTPLIVSPDYSTPVLNATTTYYVQALNGSCVSARVPVTVTVNPVPGTPVTSNQTICMNTSATLTATASGGTIQWFANGFTTTVLTTGNTFQTPVLASSTTYYVQSTNGNCTSVKVPVTVSVSPAIPSPSAPGAVICSGSTATLTASSQSGTFEWYDAPTGGNLLSPSAAFTTPALTANTTYYVQNIVNGCISPRTAATVSITTAPTQPTATGTTTICAGSNTALMASGGTGTYEWYDAATAGNLVSTSPTFVTPALNTNTTYYLQTVLGQCASARFAVPITVIAAPAAPAVSGATTICPGGTAALSATGPGITWYDAATGGNVVATTATFTTPALSATTTYYAEANNGTCAGSRSAVTVTVMVIPSPIFAYSAHTYCVSAGGNTPAPVVNPALTYNAASKTFSSDAGLIINTSTGVINITASTPGIHTVTMSFMGNPCIVSATAEVNIVLVSGSPAFTYNSNAYCQYDTNPTPSFLPGAFAGTFTSSPAGLVFVNNATGQIDLSASAPGSYTVTNMLMCSGATYSTPITIYANPIPNAGPDQTLPFGTTAQLAGTVASGTVLWTIASGTGTLQNATSINAQYVPTATETSATLTLTSNNGNCSNSDQVVINYANAAAIPVAPTASGATICTGSAITLLATAPGGTYQWYATAAGVTPLYTGPAFTTPVLTVTTDYYVQTIDANGNISPRTKVTVTVNSAPIIAGATVCFDGVATLTATGSTPGSYRWYDAATAGNLLSTADTYTTTFLLTNTSYYVESGVCTGSRTQVKVIVNPLPTVTSAIAFDACSGYAVNYVIGGTPAGITYSWSRAAVAGISNAAVNNQVSNIIPEALINTGLIPVQVIYTILPTANGCPGNPFTLTVTVYPTIAVTSPATGEICNNTASNYQVAFNFPPVYYTWARAAVPGISNAAVAGQSAATIREILTNTTNLPVVVKYTYTIYSTNCAPTNFDLLITVDPTVTTNTGSVGSVCSGQAHTYNIGSATPGATFTWQRLANASVITANPGLQTSNGIVETLITSGNQPIDVSYIITPYLNGCPGTPLNYVLTVYPNPDAPVVSSNSPVCINTTITLNTPTVTGAVYAWTGPNGFRSTVQNPVINNATKLNAGTYSLVITNNGCPSQTAVINVAVDDLPISVAGPNQNSCITATVQLNGTISGGTTTGVWSSSGSGSFSPSNTTLNAVYTPAAADLFAGIVTLTLKSTSADNCTIAQSGLTVTFFSPPTVSAGGSKSVCNQNVSVPLTGSSTNSTSVLWTSSGSGTFTPSATVLNASYVESASDLSAGSVTLTLTASNTACTVSDAAIITFAPPPTVNAGTAQYIPSGNTTVLMPTVSLANVTYLWTPNINLNDNTLKSPTATVVKDITYTVQVTDALGCVSTSTVSLFVLEPIVVYNTFTPNGDGINDTWLIPKLFEYPGATVDIYNRMGVKVFHSVDYNIPWDGTLNNQALPFGVYYYVIDTKYNGQILSGYVALVR